MLSTRKKKDKLVDTLIVATPSPATVSVEPLTYLNQAPIETSSLGYQFVQRSDTSIYQTQQLSAADQYNLVKVLLSDYLPLDLCEMFFKAAAKGVLAGLLLTLSDEYVTKILTKYEYTSEQISWINKAIRGIGLILIGAPVYATLAVPALSLILTKVLYMNENVSDSIAVSGGLLLGFVTSPLSFIPTSLSICAGIFASVKGHEATQYASKLVRNGIFSAFVEREPGLLTAHDKPSGP